MKINLKEGAGGLIFGMKQNDVKALYGNPDKEFRDEDGNAIWLYNARKLRLTFYADENLRFGYVITTNPEATLLGNPMIGGDVLAIKQFLFENGLSKWEQEDYDMAENHFNEANWLILQSEFGKVVKLELGAIINDKDEFEWKFK